MNIFYIPNAFFGLLRAFVSLYHVNFWSAANQRDALMKYVFVNVKKV